MTSEDLDHIWELFTHLDDCDPDKTPDLYKAVKYFIQEYGFDKDQLPEKMWLALAEEDKISAMEP